MVKQKREMKSSDVSVSEQNHEMVFYFCLNEEIKWT